MSVMSSAGTGSSLPLWTQPYMTAVRATIEHAAIKLRVSFVFFMAPRLSFEEASPGGLALLNSNRQRT